MKKALVGWGIFLLLLTGCVKGEAESVNQEKIKGEEEAATVEEMDEEEVAEDTEEEIEEEAMLTAVPLTIKQIGEVLYENESGAVEFAGYGENEEGYLYVVLKLSGELIKADDADLQLRVITDDSNSIIIDNKERSEIRPNGDNEEYHIYQTEEMASGKSIVRVDLSLSQGINGNFNEEHMNTVELSDTTKTTSIQGMEFIEPSAINENPLVRENDKMKITINYVDQLSVNYSKVLLAGSIEYKEDTDEQPMFNYLQPDGRASELRELRTNHSGGQLFKNTTIDFSEEVSLGYPLGKDALETLYFTIEDELFAINLKTGEELSDAAITAFQQIEEAEMDLDDKSIEGFVDVDGTRVYDAIQHTRGFSNDGIGTDNRTYYEYSVGGYNTLSLGIGAGQNQGNTGEKYDIYVYGDDFESVDGQDIPNGEPLYKKEVTTHTPLETIEVDVTGVQSIKVFIDSNIPSGVEDEEEKYIPIIISSVTVRK